jgi:hypothetical protein
VKAHTQPEKTMHEEQIAEQPEKTTQKEQVAEHHLTTAGVSQALLESGKAQGLDPAAVLALLTQFAPLALQLMTALQEILKQKQQSPPAT